jgi:hypothetical protein
MLIPDWRRVLRYSYSIRFIVLAALLSGAEFMLPLIPELWPIPPGLFAALGFFVTVAAGIARLIPQPKISGDKHE